MVDLSISSTCNVANTHCKCFEALTEEQKQLMETKQVEVRYKKGEIIAKHGAFASHVIFVCEGLVKVYLEDTTWTGTVKIRPEGSTVSIWTVMEAVDCR